MSTTIYTARKVGSYVSLSSGREYTHVAEVTVAFHTAEQAADWGDSKASELELEQAARAVAGSRHQVFVKLNPDIYTFYSSIGLRD